MNVATPIIIGPMIATEAEAVARVVTEVILQVPFYNDAARQGESAKFQPANLREMIVQDPDAVLVARAGTDIVGFCLSRYDDFVIALLWYGVTAAWRRRGVAQQLLVALEATVQRRGCHKIFADCRTVNDPSKTLLSRLGYRPVATVLNHWYGQDFILWEKPIA